MLQNDKFIIFYAEICSKRSFFCLYCLYRSKLKMMNYRPKNGHFYQTVQSVKGVLSIEFKNDTAKMADTIKNIDMKWIISLNTSQI